MDTWQQYEAKKARIAAQLKAIIAAKKNPELSKETSNLFRASHRQSATLDVRYLNQVIHVDVHKRTLDVEGMTTYEDVIAATLQHNLAPAIVPELKTITVGGVYAGIGVETTSFRYGFMHETVIEADILTGTGEVITCSRTKNSDLFFGFPNSYGSLGYALRIKVQLFPTEPFVKLTRKTYTNARSFIDGLSRLAKKARNSHDIDFIEGTGVAPNVYVISVGSFVDSAPYTRDLYKTPFYRSIGTDAEDYMTTHDYFFRYDPDWFWCSRIFGMENALVRVLTPKSAMRSDKYYRLAGLSGRLPGVKHLRKLLWRREALVQDIEAPTEKALEFVEWFDREIGMKPYLVAPIQQFRNEHYPLSPIKPGKQFMNIGFYAPHKTNKPDLHFTRRIHEKALAMGVRKMLYSVTTWTEEEFWQIFERAPYEKLKKKYDPHGTFKGIYEKISRKQQPQHSRERTQRD
jgi:FAD/FMN-containing dehydrogenase